MYTLCPDTLRIVINKGKSRIPRLVRNEPGVVRENAKTAKLERELRRLRDVNQPGRRQSDVVAGKRQSKLRK